MNDGIQCDECRQWNHGDCEGVSERLFELYQMQEMPYICLSCRHLDDDLDENEQDNVSLNSSLLDDCAMRGDESEESHPQISTSSNQDMTALKSTEPPTLGKEILCHTPEASSYNPKTATLNDDSVIQTEVASTGDEARSALDLNPKPDLPPGKKKKQTTAVKKGNKRDDSMEQLSHARSVIYSLEKQIQDKDTTNKILNEELSLLRRLYDPSRQESDTHSHSMADRHHTSSSNHQQQRDAHRGHVHSNQQSQCHTHPCGSGQVESCYHKWEIDSRMMRERLNVLEIEHLKHRINQIEQANHHMNVTATLLNERLTRQTLNQPPFPLYPHVQPTLMYNGIQPPILHQHNMWNQRLYTTPVNPWINVMQANPPPAFINNAAAVPPAANQIPQTGNYLNNRVNLHQPPIVNPNQIQQTHPIQMNQQRNAPQNSNPHMEIRKTRVDEVKAPRRVQNRVTNAHSGLEQSSYQPTASCSPMRTETHPGTQSETHSASQQPASPEGIIDLCNTTPPKRNRDESKDGLPMSESEEVRAGDADRSATTSTDGAQQGAQKDEYTYLQSRRENPSSNPAQQNIQKQSFLVTGRASESTAMLTNDSELPL